MSGYFSAGYFPGAVGSGDWTDTEKAQIRKRLGIDGSSSAPAATPDLFLASSYTAPDNAGVSFLNKWVLNRLIESPAGTFKLYDNDDVTVLKTWAVDDVNKTRGKAV